MTNPLLAFLLILCLSIGANSGATVWVSSTEPPINIGVIKTEHLEATAATQAILLDKLRREFQPRVVNLTYYNWDGLEKAVRGHSLDLVLVTSAFFSTIEHEKGVKALIGLVRNGSVDADHILAGTLVINKPCKSCGLEDIKGKKLYLAKNADESNIVFRGYLRQKGIRERNFFHSVQLLNGGVEKLLETLNQEKEAIGLLPTCVLEDISETKHDLVKKLSVIDEKSGDGLDCKRTTDLYPGWVLAAIKQDDMPMIRKATATALNTVMAGSLQWGFPPEKFESIRNVLIDLKLGPYAQNTFRLTDVLYANRYWVFTLIGVILLIITHSVLVSIQVRRKTRSIEKLMEEKVRFTEEMAQTRERIHNMERFQSVSQLSALLAHELKQPLGAIRNYSRGLIKRSQKGNVSQEVLSSALDVIVNQSDKAASIVDQVRTYAKSSSVQRELLDLNNLVRHTVETFKSSYDTLANIRVLCTNRPLPVEVNSLELELVIVNLLKNASDALQGIPAPLIEVQTTIADQVAVLSIKDNGRKYAKEDVKKFFRPMFSTKQQGMGLGLTIAVYIIEGHGGRIEAFSNPEGGLTFRLTLPLVREK